MGMFDYIRCEVPLPDGWKGPGDNGLQTKQFECEMITHVITKEGRLMFDRGSWEAIPKEKRPFPKANDEDIRSLAGSMKWIPKYVDSNYHGYVHFGGLEVVGRKPKDQKGWEAPIYRKHDYKAKFTDGQLEGIELDSEAYRANSVLD